MTNNNNNKEFKCTIQKNFKIQSLHKIKLLKIKMFGLYIIHHDNWIDADKVKCSFDNDELRIARLYDNGCESTIRRSMLF